MKLKKIANSNYVEIIAKGIIIDTTEDALNILGEAYYQGYDKIIINSKHLNPDFFNLRSGLAGEILQKFSNYRMRIAIIGDFNAYKSRSLQDFIRESNRSSLVNFLSSVAEAANK